MVTQAAGSAPVAAQPRTVVVRMVSEKPCKGSVRYVAGDEKAMVTNAYLSRRFANPMPQAITVTVREAAGAAAPAPGVTIGMTRNKECRGSVRYGTADDQAVVSNLYVDRAFAEPMPNAILVTVE